MATHIRCNVDEKFARDCAKNFYDQLIGGAEPKLAFQNLFLGLHTSGWEHWQVCAIALLERELPRAASEFLWEAISRWPRQLGLKYWLGVSLRVAKDDDGAAVVFREILDERPDHKEASASLAFLLRDAGRIEAACRVALARFYNSEQCGVELMLVGGFLGECRRADLALDLYRSRQRLVNQHPQLSYSAGRCAFALGHFSEGRAYCAQAIDNGLDGENLFGAWLLLSHAQQYENIEHSDLRLFENAWNDPQAADDMRASAGFCLAKMLDDVEDYPGAARVLRQANRIEREARQWDPVQWNQYVEERLSEALKHPGLNRPALMGFTPVFVVGLPRTGTTLVADRLGRHPEVCNRGELNWMPVLYEKLKAAGKLQNVNALIEARKVYRTQLLQDDTPAMFYVDKNPFNFNYLDLIFELFPNARVIHCLRDLRDTALSIWGNTFSRGALDFSYDMGHIRAYVNGYKKIMQYWEKRYQSNILCVEYEALAQAPQKTLEKIGDFVGISASSWVDLRPRDGANVDTASVWQARQNIYKSSIGRWRGYQEELPELIEYFEGGDLCSR